MKKYLKPLFCLSLFVGIFSLSSFQFDGESEFRNSTNNTSTISENTSLDLASKSEKDWEWMYVIVQKNMIVIGG